jgi:hypothetical protein
MTSDPKEMVGILLGIPDVRVLDLVEDDAGQWVEIETTTEDAHCRACGRPAVPDRRRVVEMKSREPMFERPLALSWKTRGWKCVNASCPVGTFFEKADSGTCILISDQTVAPFALSLSLADADTFRSFRIRLGEPGTGPLGISGPACDSRAGQEMLFALNGRLGRVDWVYDVAL